MAAVRIRTGRLVLVRHGKAEGGQVALIEGHGGGLVKVRTWYAGTKRFAENAKSIPARDVLGVPEPKDERVVAAKAAMKERQKPDEGGEEKPDD